MVTMVKGEKPKNLKLHNTHTILNLFRRMEQATVAEVSTAINLSKTTVKKIVDLLVEEGLLVSAGKGDSTDEGGKKPELYRFNNNYGYVASVHVTPDEIISVSTDLKAMIDFKSRTPVPRGSSLEEVIALIARLVCESVERKAESGEKLVGIVVALPGLVDSVKGVSIYSPHYPRWGRNVPFIAPLRAAIGYCSEAPIFIDDVNRYQAIAEREKGVAGGVRNFIVIDALNEGVGSGIVLNGALLQGNQSLSGEIGHMTVNPVNGDACICGNQGCFEAMVSARRVLRLLAEAKAGGRSSMLFDDQLESVESDDGTSHPGDITLDRICAGAARGDPLCRELMDDVARWFLVGIGNIIMSIDPELIVIQGQYVKAGAYFIDALREGIMRIGLPLVEKKVQIKYSVMGEDRGVVGGAAMAIADFLERRLIR
jgi:predicted NBD/HSP70 family sugar kinase